MIKKLMVLLFLAFFATPAFGRDCKIEAKAVIGFLEFEVQGCKVEGSLINAGGDAFVGTFKVDLTKLDADQEETRTKHMHETYLQSSKYPQAKFELSKVKFGDKTFKGRLTLHGQTREISGKLDFPDQNKFVAEFDVNIVEFGMEKPSYGPIVVGENIRVTVTL